jgi:hypothetical protein
VQHNPYSVLVHTNKKFEYIALHRPVIAARLDSTLAYFPDDCFLYFDADDDIELAERIRFAYENPEQMKARTAAAYACYENYRWEREKKKYVGVYEELLGGTPRLQVESRRPKGSSPLTARDPIWRRRTANTQ